jgi:stage II sporulation protein D
MGSLNRHGLACFLALALLYPLGCSSALDTSGSPGDAPRIRVRLLPGVEKVVISCGVPPLYQLSNQSTSQLLNSPKNAVFSLSLSSQGWLAGNANLGGTLGTTLHLQPDHDGTVSIEGVAYRGKFRFIPVGGNKFDVINELDLDSYLAGVIAREMPGGWNEQAYMAQAVVARTYALYERNTAGLNRYWDVWPDIRSQVYGGIPAETAKSRKAVSVTAGIVVAYAPAGSQPQIFKAYFSSCCGGVSQSAAEAFGETYIPPLCDQDVHSACRASPNFTWGPIVIDKGELSRRFRLYGQHGNRPEQNIGTITHVEIQEENHWGRPVRFLVSDSKGNRFSLTGEEFRWAVNSGASENTVLYSSFVKIIDDSSQIRFVEGHGRGHGVGMCQWCAEKRAEDGMRHEDIILAAFPTAVLKRAY